MEPDLPTQLATLSGLAAPLIVSGLRRCLVGKPKWTLPVLCAVLAIGISVASQLGAAAVTGDDPSGWGMVFGVAMSGLGLLGRQVLHEVGSGERIPNPASPPPLLYSQRPYLPPGRSKEYRRRPPAVGLLVMVLLAAPGLVEGQALRPGTGFELRSDDRYQSASSATPLCPATYRQPGGGRVDSSLNPWSVLGVSEIVGAGSPVAVPGAVYALDEATGRWGGSAIVAGRVLTVSGASEAGARSLLAQAAWEHLLALRYVPLAPQGYQCLIPGAAGTNHGAPCRSRLEALCRAGHPLLSPGFDCRMSGRELSDCSQSHTAYARITAAHSTLGASPPGGPSTPCPASWSCEPLSRLPAAQRSLPILRYGSTPGAACSLHSVGWVWTTDRASCWDLPGCSRPAGVPLGGRYSLGPECWEDVPPTGPVCGDGVCEAPEVSTSCPEDCPPIPTPTGVLEISSVTCVDGAWGFEGRLPDGARWAGSADAGGAFHLLDSSGREVLRVSPGPCPSSCPEAGILGTVRTVPGLCE
jgi:hypothetical protein